LQRASEKIICGDCAGGASFTAEVAEKCRGERKEMPGCERRPKTTDRILASIFQGLSSADLE